MLTRSNSTKPVGTSYHFAAVTPSDSVDLAQMTQAIWVGTGGDVEVHDINDNAVVIPGVPDGTLLPIATMRILDANTTASGIVALF